jgi:hypothetical protein
MLHSIALAMHAEKLGKPDSPGEFGQPEWPWSRPIQGIQKEAFVRFVARVRPGISTMPHPAFYFSDGAATSVAQGD